VQTLAFPLSVPIIFGYIMGLTTLSETAPSSLFKVLAYLPFTAPLDMPVLVAFHDVSWWNVAAAVLISLGSTVVVARFAAAIYRRSILRTGRRVTFREALGIGRRAAA
jgi:ABC-2 type transport system permease protein